MRHIIITWLSESEIGKKIGIKKHKKKIQSTCRRLAETDLKGHLRLTKNYHQSEKKGDQVSLGELMFFLGVSCK